MKLIPSKFNHGLFLILFHKVHIRIFFLFLLLSANLLYSQSYYTQNDSDFIQFNFYKQLTTWNWQSELNYFSGDSNSWKYGVHEQVQSNLLIPARGKRQWKDENTAIGQLYMNHFNFNYGFYMRSWYQNDEQSSSSNEFGNQVLGIFSNYQYKNNFLIIPYAGVQQSKNRKYIDWGMDVGLKGKVKNYRLGEYNMSTDLESDFDIYDKRQNFENEFHLTAGTNFSEYTSDSISINLSATKKEYYDNDQKQKKLIDVYILYRTLKNNLNYNISPHNRFTLMTLVQTRTLDFVTDRNIFFLDNEIRFNHYGSNLFYKLSLRTNDETQDNTDNRTNNRTRQTIMKLDANYKLAPDKEFEFNLAYSKLQYDTPDINNTEDRDEQRYIVELGYNQKLSQYISMNWNLYTYFYHKIYLSSMQSQNNNWNRVYILNPRVNYDYGKIRNLMDTKILANYTVYDFEELFTRTRSFIFRKYSISDSLLYNAYGSIDFGFFTRIELEDKGNYFDKNRTQQLIQSYQSSFYNFFVANENFLGLNIRIGYTIYERIEWIHIPNKKRNRKITNDGPYAGINLNITGKLIFGTYVSLSNLDDSAIGSTKYATGSLKLNYLF